MAKTSDQGKKKEETAGEKKGNPHWFRESVESFAVALILAFLFRAFVAEAFVIPTGSMAPTLMGAHKDVRCPECGFDYQCGASSEFDELGYQTNNLILTTTCPLCRFELPLDLSNNANHYTFSGDRILVSKLSYIFKKPKRWEVIVFKFPGDARMNYIKRCVGLPDEKLRVYNGDIFVTSGLSKGETTETIARKPANVVETVLQPLYDSRHLPKSLVKAGMPSAWQPWPAGEKAWSVVQTEAEWSAKVESTKADSVHWLRYFHRTFGPKAGAAKAAQQPWRLRWDLSENNAASRMDPYFGIPVFDFTCYNTSMTAQKSSILDRNGRPSALYESGRNPRDYARFPFFSSDMRNCNIENDGVNWVGDLACEFDLDIPSKSGHVVLDLVEGGVHHTCTIDLAAGQAELTITKDGSILEALVDGNQKVARSVANISIRSGRVRLKFANVDDQLLLWVNGKLQRFPGDGAFDLGIRPGSNIAPVRTPDDPLDVAPVGIGGRGATFEVKQARVWRDLYYISTAGRDYVLDPSFVQESLMDPEKLASTKVLQKRTIGQYPTEKDEYFPMGDNSNSSLDARSWGGLPDRLLIGRAILVFWPHHWNRPIPFTPNFKKFRLIR